MVLLVARAELFELLDLSHCYLLRLLRQLQFLQLRLHFFNFILFFLRLPATLHALAIFDFLLERLQFGKMGDFNLDLLLDKVGYHIHASLDVILIQDGLELSFQRTL